MKRFLRIMSLCLPILLAFEFLVFAPLIIMAMEIHGRVTDVAEKPLKYADISLNGPIKNEATTDLEGKYSFKNLSPGEYQIAVKTLGYDEAQCSVTLGEENRVEDFHLRIKQELLDSPYSLALCRIQRQEFEQAHEILFRTNNWKNEEQRQQAAVLQLLLVWALTEGYFEASSVLVDATSTASDVDQTAFKEKTVNASMDAIFWGNKLYSLLNTFPYRDISCNLDVRDDFFLSESMSNRADIYERIESGELLSDIQLEEFYIFIVMVSFHKIMGHTLPSEGYDISSGKMIWYKPGTLENYKPFLSHWKGDICWTPEVMIEISRTLCTIADRIARFYTKVSSYQEVDLLTRETNVLPKDLSEIFRTVSSLIQDINTTEALSVKTYNQAGINKWEEEYVKSAPMAVELEASPVNGEAPLAVNFRGNVVGGRYPYKWTLVDEKFESDSQVPRHNFVYVYKTFGEHTAIAIVTDKYNRQAQSKPVKITVSGGVSEVLPASLVSFALYSRSFQQRVTGFWVDKNGTPVAKFKLKVSGETKDIPIEQIASIVIDSYPTTTITTSASANATGAPDGMFFNSGGKNIPFINVKQAKLYPIIFPPSILEKLDKAFTVASEEVPRLSVDVKTSDGQRYKSNMEMLIKVIAEMENTFSSDPANKQNADAHLFLVMAYKSFFLCNFFLIAPGRVIVELLGFEGIHKMVEWGDNGCSMIREYQRLVGKDDPVPDMTKFLIDGLCVREKIK